MPETGCGNGGASSFLTDAIGIGTLTRLVPRELVDEVVGSLGRKEIRRNKLPARVMVYFVMAMTLFYGDGYEEVMRKLTAGLKYAGTWWREWKMPTPGGLCQARQRLGPEVVQELSAGSRYRARCGSGCHVQLSYLVIRHRVSAHINLSP